MKAQPAPFVPVVLASFTCPFCSASSSLLKKPEGAVMHAKPMCKTFQRLTPRQYMAEVAAQLPREGVPLVGG